MNNKKLILLFAAVILTGLLISFFIYRGRHRFSMGGDDVHVEMDIYESVPTDAVVIYRSSSLAGSLELISGENALLAPYTESRQADLYRILSRLNPNISAFPIVYSLHYTGKNSLTGLLAVQTGEQTGLDSLMRGVSYSSLRDGTYRLGGTELYMSYYGGRLMFCTSSIVLKAAIRHLENQVSMNDIDAFHYLAESYSDVSQVLFINHNQIGKVFSGMGAYKTLGYASFFGDYTDWTAMSLSSQPHKLSASGHHYNDMPGEYSSVFNETDVLSEDVYSLFPAETAFLLRISTPEFERYMKNFLTYVDINASSSKYKARLKNYMSRFEEQRKNYEMCENRAEDRMKDPKEWLDSLSPREIAFAAFPSADTLEYVTALRVKTEFDYARLYSKTLAKDRVLEMKPFPYEGYFGVLMGRFFRSTRNSYYMYYKDWCLIGSREYLEHIINGDYEYFSLREYVAPALLEDRNASLKILVSLSEMSKAIPSYFNRTYSEHVRKLISSGNYGYLEYSLSSVDKQYRGNLDIYLDSLPKLPAPEFVEGIVPISGDTIITLPEGPYRIKNHLNGKDGYLKQYPNCKLQLLNEKRMGIWTIDFSLPIRGYVAQVDYLKNGKLQMYFCAGDKVYCLDRTGHFVRGFPKKLAKNVEMGPVVYDLNGTKDYTFMVMNTDNSFTYYDIDGKRVEGWSDIKTAEKVIDMPELKEIGGKRYWIVRSAGRMYIYDFQGRWIDENDPRHIIRRDSPVDVVSEHSVLVQCLDDREYFVDLNTGRFKRNTRR